MVASEKWDSGTERAIGAWGLRFYVCICFFLYKACSCFIYVCVCVCVCVCVYRRRQWHPTPVLLPGQSHERRSLVGCSPWGHEESGTTERLHFHFSLSCIGEGNGNPLQCSCLENPRDGGAWWAAIMGSHRVGHDWNDLAAAATIVLIHKILLVLLIIDSTSGAGDFSF